MYVSTKILLQRYAKKTYPYMVFNNYYCSNAYLFEKESVTLHNEVTKRV